MEEPYIYTDLNEVPVRWRTYKGARLNLDQVNDIIDYAYRHPVNEGIPNYGEARAVFEESHEIKQSFWIAKENS